MVMIVTVVGRAKENAFVYTDAENDAQLTVARLSVEPFLLEGYRVEEVLLLLSEGDSVQKDRWYQVSGRIARRRLVTRSGKTPRLPIWEVRVSSLQPLNETEKRPQSDG
ncbi:conserved protein of unknown function [Kyrpidia spormannii]|uniref:Uncharacterized protein n=3 Tax=Alicyclobacillaceae TaxID=186823 RepID=A0ACA8ZBA3_9BACL|nr:conserved protein of unknown function [Kyrpidia spormannii]CAB3394715.1 conserved protein of unknown function [Kyrpidia spormannii]